MAVTLFEDAGLEQSEGSRMTFFIDDGALTNNEMVNSTFDFTDTWNDETSSLVITGEAVDFYENTGWTGASWRLQPGRYDQGDLLNAGMPNDIISSFDISPFEHFHVA